MNWFSNASWRRSHIEINIIQVVDTLTIIIIILFYHHKKKIFWWSYMLWSILNILEPMSVYKLVYSLNLVWSWWKFVPIRFWCTVYPTRIYKLFRAFQDVRGTYVSTFKRWNCIKLNRKKAYWLKKKKKMLAKPRLKRGATMLCFLRWIL